jgi:hypothetical protein
MSFTNIFSRRRAAAGVAAVALGAALAACGSSAPTATTTGANGAAATPARTQGMPPGLGKAVTGTVAAKAKAAALAKYPGTVERVVQLPDGSYGVHVLRKTGGELHVRVSKDFKVTGTETGPPAGGAPPAASGTASQS